MNRDVIFMQMPKSASSSMGSILKKYDIQIIDHNIRNPDYVSLSKYMESHPEKEFFAFTFVRNPWDRVVSAFHYLKEGGNNPEDRSDYETYLEQYDEDFERFVKQAFLTKDIFEQLHFRPQYRWVTDEDNNLLVDFVGKYETLEDDFRCVCQIIGVEEESLPVMNKSNHKQYRQYYNSKTKHIIEEAYAIDIQLFNFNF
jgi:hypothetical protein